MKKLTKEWVRKAEGDLAAVRRIRKGGPPLHDEICFHCQQAVEKYLKAFLQESRLIIPRIHDLLRLLDLVLPQHPDLRSMRSRLRILQRFAVDIRYPGFSANASQSRRAVQVADTVRAEIRRRLGLRRRPRLS